MAEMLLTIGAATAEMLLTIEAATGATGAMVNVEINRTIAAAAATSRRWRQRGCRP